MRYLKTLCLLTLLCGAVANSAEKPNILIITVDDMSADSVGAFGCRLPETTPNIDRLAQQCVRFEHAHVVVGNCMPSRNVMWSGRYPHNNGVEGFYQVKDPDYPVLCDLMQNAGYFTAIRHKVGHSTPYSPYRWDLELDTLPDGTKAHVKDAASYGASMRQAIAAAKAAGKPFCALINVADPHKPFYAQGKNPGETKPDRHVPSRIFTANEVPIPGFLFDDPIVREELAFYYSTVRRSDDAVGAVIQALEASGAADDTFILFLSDHGMPLPFAKTQLYHHSTHTPLMVRWPGVTQAGSVENQHMVSAVDFVPTLLDVVGAPHPTGLDGRSFASVLKGETQTSREQVFKEYNENSGASRDPMRAVQTKEFLYIFNPWSNGERIFATATSGTWTYKRLKALSESGSALAERHHLYQYRLVEELYNIANDPDCLVNLIDSPSHQKELDRLHRTLEAWMVETDDHILEAFRNRHDAAAMEAYVQARESEAMARRAAKRKKQNKAKAKQKASTMNRSARRNRTDLFSLEMPNSIVAGTTLTVTIQHTLKESLGEQKIHVTLKTGKQPQRLHREVVSITGTGSTSIRFELPSTVKDNLIHVAAFVGESYASNLQYTQVGPTSVR